MRTHPARLAVLAPLLLILLPSITAAQDGSAWPFGTTGRVSMNAKDDWNLGIIGAKARDADTEPPPPARGGRRQVARLRPAERGDPGPKRLLIEILHPEGPGKKAGLQLGDVVYGVNKRPFTKGCLDPLAKALVKAESGKGTFVLNVERDGKKIKVTVDVGKGGRDLAKPTRGKGRRYIFDQALAWLAQRQDEDGGFSQTLSSHTGAVVQASLAGLAWLCDGSDLQSGKYQSQIQKAADFVIRYVDKRDTMGGLTNRGGANWNQSNWGYVYAAIFLGELQVRSPTGKVKVQLQSIADAIVKHQEKSGGWAHGPGGPNALDYLELNIVTGLALSGLGSAKVAGIAVDKDCVKRAMKYLAQSGSGDGGVAYADKAGQKGQGNIGRTAVAWLGARNLGLGKSPWGLKMGRYVSGHAGDVLDGHASLQLHVFHAGVAAHASGSGATKKFWAKLQRDLVLARAPDGSLQPRPWHETLSMGTNSDVSFGQVWTPATWAIVLGCDAKAIKGAGLPVWLGKSKPRR
ncbi:MAG: hypothetical protein CMJ83_10335 [Planctomycetes bacterium]|nr:hypothetical protein [Planctomycetota bacterium]